MALILLALVVALAVLGISGLFRALVPAERQRDRGPGGLVGGGGGDGASGAHGDAMFHPGSHTHHGGHGAWDGGSH